MAINEFLSTYQEAMLNRKMVNPLSGSNTAMVNSRLGISPPKRTAAETSGFGNKVPEWLTSRTTGALDRYMQNKSETTSKLAGDYTDKAAGQVPVNEWGIVQDKMTNFSDAFNKQLGAVGDIGKAHLATVEAQSEWQRLQNQAEQNAGYTVNWTPGASGKGAGAQAVSIAMTAKGTPYKWGGNSLTGGVDCSGLVQQVYKQMGISLPRTTYEQAKAGKVISTGALMPGDLVFYNTGSNDPNGIGSLSHVAIYIGNGQVIHAPGRGQNVKISSLTSSGTPARAVRPW